MSLPYAPGLIGGTWPWQSLDQMPWQQARGQALLPSRPLTSCPCLALAYLGLPWPARTLPHVLAAGRHTAYSRVRTKAKSAPHRDVVFPPCYLNHQRPPSVAAGEDGVFLSTTSPWPSPCGSGCLKVLPCQALPSSIHTPRVCESHRARTPPSLSSIHRNPRLCLCLCPSLLLPPPLVIVLPAGRPRYRTPASSSWSTTAPPRPLCWSLATFARSSSCQSPPRIQLFFPLLAPGPAASC